MAFFTIPARPSDRPAEVRQTRGQKEANCQSLHHRWVKKGRWELRKSDDTPAGALEAERSDGGGDDDAC